MTRPLLISSILLVLCCYTFASNYRVNPANQFFVDSDKRVVIFHGVNAIYKLAPFYPPVLDKFDADLSLSEVDFQNLHSWGLNFVRLYVAWEGTEPIRGQYNMTYLEIIKGIVQTAAKYNITVILDAHQDMVNRKLCGEGFPDWAVNRTDFPAPLDVNITFDDQGHAKIADCTKIDFWKFTTTNDVKNAWKAFYTDVDGIAESFTNFWRLVADYFKDEPNVLGYEIINEPCTFDNSVIQQIDKKYLQPLYQRVHNKIREVDNNTIIFFESFTDDIVSIGFTEGPGGPEYNDRQAFAYHIYCPSVDHSGEPTDPAICTAADTAAALLKTGAAKRLGVAAFMTEFGAVHNGPKSVDEINRVTNLADNYLHSWSYWQLKYYDDFTTLDMPGNIESFYEVDGSLQMAKVSALTRTYAYATCGVPVSQSFDPRTGQYDFVYNVSNQCNGKNTELYVSEDWHYATGFNYVFANCLQCGLHRINENERNYYQIVLTPDIAEGTQVHLTIVVAAGTPSKEKVVV